MSKSLIYVTNSALKQLRKIMLKDKSKGILFSVKSGGCNGFEYKFDTINTFENEENIFVKDDVKIEICNKSLFYLLETKVDWKEDIMGRGFKFENPMANASCGCGSSFSIKI